MANYFADGSKIDVAGNAAALSGYNIIVFGDSNVYYTYGVNKRDAGFIFNRLATKYALGEVENHGANGSTIYQMAAVFSAYVTDEVAARYNNPNTVFIFHSGTNDTVTAMNNDSLVSASPVHGIDMIVNVLKTKLPNAMYFYVIPPDTDWDVWSHGQGDTEYYVERRMADKHDKLVEYLKRYRIPYVDSFYDSGVQTSMMADGIHLVSITEDGNWVYNKATSPAFAKYYALVHSKLLALNV